MSCQACAKELACLRSSLAALEAEKAQRAASESMSAIHIDFERRTIQVSGGLEISLDLLRVMDAPDPGVFYKLRRTGAGLEIVRFEPEAALGSDDMLAEAPAVLDVPGRAERP